jgi:hypothetical protein
MSSASWWPFKKRPESLVEALSPPRPLPNGSMQVSDVPARTANWKTIARFAYTFAFTPENERCLTEQPKSGSLTDLRSTLFSLQRAFNHRGDTPAGEDMSHIRRLVEGIRQKVAKCEFD